MLNNEILQIINSVKSYIDIKPKKGYFSSICNIDADSNSTEYTTTF